MFRPRIGCAEMVVGHANLFEIQVLHTFVQFIAMQQSHIYLNRNQQGTHLCVVSSSSSGYIAFNFDRMDVDVVAVLVH